MSIEKELEGFTHISRKLANRGAHTNNPVNFGLETILIGTKMMSGGKVAYDISKNVKESLDSKDPLIVSILCTTTTDTAHELILDITNQSRHGLHLEKISLKDPERPDIGVKRHERSKTSKNLYSDNAESKIGATANIPEQFYSSEDNALPDFLPSVETCRVRVIFPLFEDERMECRDHGKLSIFYVLAGDLKGLQEKVQVFSVRRAEK